MFDTMDVIIGKSFCNLLDIRRERKKEKKKCVSLFFNVFFYTLVDRRIIAEVILFLVLDWFTPE